MVETPEIIINLFLPLNGVTVLVFSVRPCPELPGNVLADLADVFQAELVQHRPHVAVDVLVGEV